jgi:hypothetical protein
LLVDRLIVTEGERPVRRRGTQEPPYAVLISEHSRHGTSDWDIEFGAHFSTS